MDKMQYSIENLKNIQNIINLVDRKAGIILVFYGIALSFFSPLLQKVKIVDIMTQGGPKLILLFICGILSAGFIILIIIDFFRIIFKIIIARLAKSYKPEDDNYFYFEHIARACNKSDKEIFIKNYPAIFDNENQKPFEMIQSQIWENSRILSKKIRYLNRSYIFCFMIIMIGICLSVLTLFF